MTERRLFTSSSVLRGHPDKLCDRISDALVDAHLTLDPGARMRAETAAAGQVIFVATDARVRGEVDVTGVVRSTLAETGYDPSDLDPERCAMLAQSSVMTPPWQRDGRGPAADPDAVVPPSRPPCSATPAPRRPSGCRCRSTWPTSSPAGWIGWRCTRVAGLGPDGSVQVTVEYEDDAAGPDRRAGGPGAASGRAAKELRTPSASCVLAPTFEHSVRPEPRHA